MLVSKVVIHFKDEQFIRSERNLLKTPIEVFAEFGGLLSLCVGFSIVGVIEVVYYCTLRMYLKMKKQSKIKDKKRKHK